MADRSVTGRVSVDGQPLPGADVLVFSEPARRLAGAAQTEADGTFAVTARGEEPLVLLAKVRGPVCSLEAVPVPGPEPIEIDVRAADGFAELSGSADETGDPPLVVRIDPARVEGVPDWLVAFAKQRREGVFESTYCEVPLTDGAFRVRLRHGDYRIRGDRFVDEPVGQDGTSSATLIVQGVSDVDGGGAAPGDPHGGFLVSVGEDRRIRLAVGHMV